jgi:hypothetical protein
VAAAQGVVVTGLPDPAADLAGFVLAVAEIRERRAKHPFVPQTQWRANAQEYDRGDEEFMVLADDPDEPYGSTDVARTVETWEAADHIAAEANPAHALAEVALWRGIAERHYQEAHQTPPWCAWCTSSWPCPDLLAAVAAGSGVPGRPAMTGPCERICVIRTGGRLAPSDVARRDQMVREIAGDIVRRAIAVAAGDFGALTRWEAVRNLACSAETLFAWVADEDPHLAAQAYQAGVGT